MVFLPTEPTEEMLLAGLPNLVGIENSTIRPVGQFYSGMTASESEEANWRFHGKERLRRAYLAMIKNYKENNNA